MHHQRFASVLASKGRSLLVWTAPLAATVVVGTVVGGCPGPDPQIIGGSGGGGRGTSSAEASSTSSQGGGSSSASVSSTGTGKPDGGCGPDLELCNGNCVDTTNGDVNNCGKCGNACATTNVSQSQCVSSACILQCTDKFANIDPLMNPNCDTPAKRVFVTSMTVNSKFGSTAGGIHGADQLCNQLAPAGGSMWIAWVSVADQATAMTILTGFQGAYVLMDPPHSLVTTTTELLMGAPLRHRIDTTETGTALANNASVAVWTGTNGDGAATGFDCSGWSSNTSNATTGDWSVVGTAWSNVGQTTGCGGDNRVYCFEQ